MNFTFQKEELQDLSQIVKKEWSLTNGIGGYAGASISNALCRTHQGYLIAAFHPPVERHMVFSKTDEKIIGPDESYDFSTNVYKGNVYEAGNKFLTSFTYDGTIQYIYQTKDITLTKELTLIQGENRVAIAYTVENKGPKSDLMITPFLNYREHSHLNTKAELNFVEHPFTNGFTLIPEADDKVAITLLCSAGCLEGRGNKYAKDIELPIEVELETEGLETHYTPYDIRVSLPERSLLRFSLMCEVTYNEHGRARAKEILLAHNASFLEIEKQRAYIKALLDQVGYTDTLARQLTVASNAFLSYRASTELTTVLAGLPWFTDWGRDTMIAFTGLTLCTKRYDKAKEILETFARYVNHGMVPNMFPDDGQAPLYNTVDASLWYFYAVHKYLSYDTSKEASDFIYEKIFPVLTLIIDAYENGTDFSIYMDKDYLIHAGSGVDQVTWMDVRVGDWVPTPRHGKPVEINALWFNALCVMIKLCERYHEDGSHYEKLAKKVKASFVEEFWNDETGCLYDVLGDDEKDPTIRPNQIFALSLPFTMLTPEMEKSILDVVTRDLYVGVGLRSLAPSDEQYHKIYCGALEKRDAAYHQGTAWGFLLGAYFTAFMRVNGYNNRSAKKANEMLNPIRAHLLEGGIGSISEIFDGDAPHRERGCYAQAWSVGEVLRAYSEDILPFLSNK